MTRSSKQKTPKFEVGDEVVVKEHPANWPPVGTIGVVADVDASDNRLPWLVAWCDQGRQTQTWCYASQLKRANAHRGAQRERTLPDDSAERKQVPLFTGPLMYFPAALAAVAKLCKDGNDKHNPGEPMHHARAKSSDHEDTILRHMLDAREGNGRDANGTPHVVNAAWRALAHCQEWLEKHDGAPLAPGAKVEQ